MIYHQTKFTLKHSFFVMFVLSRNLGCINVSDRYWWQMMSTIRCWLSIFNIDFRSDIPKKSLTSHCHQHPCGLKNKRIRNIFDEQRKASWKISPELFDAGNFQNFEVNDLSWYAFVSKSFLLNLNFKKN